MPDAERGGVRGGVVALALALLAACLWALTHRYLDLGGDAELYALQALARLHPALAGDVYLQDVSQDRYTVFTQFYAQLIAACGLREAGRGLFVAATLWLYCAAWALVRRVADAPCAWVAVALLMITVGHYGSYSVLHFGESFLTARNVAEALIMTALACHCAGYRLTGAGLAAAALLIHPLLALPGLLMLLCLSAGSRLAAAGALAGVAATALLAVAAQRYPQATGPLALIDGDWLEMVRERSQFLFLQLWRLPDWKGNLLPFASLALTLAAVDERRIRELAWGSMIVGAAGLAVGWIACTIGPVAILLQGQAWRWVWIPSFMSIVLLAPTLQALWRDPRCGPACALVLVTGWTCTAVDTWAGIGLAALLWLSRPWITPRITTLLRGAALTLGLVLLAWTVANAWTILGAPPAAGGREPLPLTYARALLGMQTVALGLFCAAAWWLWRQRGPQLPALACVALLALACLALPAALRLDAYAEDFAAYAPWRAAIPPDSNVWVAGEQNSANFVWLTLQRPDYLSIDQSAGVVFSRATAAEIRRRSEVVAPLEEPGWRIMTFLARRARGEIKPTGKLRQWPLTATSLAGVCADPRLGFVIAREPLGFGALRSAARGGHYKDWFLYDCRRVRASGAAA